MMNKSKSGYLIYELSYIEKSTQNKITKHFDAKSEKAAIKKACKFFEEISCQYDDPWLTKSEQVSIKVKNN